MTRPFALIIQPNGKIVAAGSASRAGGALDGGFGAGGKRTTAFSKGADFVNALVLQPDNKLVAVGGGSGADIALARYITGLPGASGQLLNISTLGPSLADSGVSGALQDPTLQLFGGEGSIAFNDNWKQDQEAAIKATGIPPSRATEAAIVRTLAPGTYTAVVRGKNDSVGVGLVEVYDLAQGAESELANISSRGFVDTGDNALIGGFIVGGNARVVIRALGPSLGDQVWRARYPIRLWS